MGIHTTVAQLVEPPSQVIPDSKNLGTGLRENLPEAPIFGANSLISHRFFIKPFETMFQWKHNNSDAWTMKTWFPVSLSFLPSSSDRWVPYEFDFTEGRALRRAFDMTT